MVSFPAIGFSSTNGQEGGLASAANQSGGKWPSSTIYNQYQGTAGVDSQANWLTWATVNGITQAPPYWNVQVSPYPLNLFGGSGINFNASDLANNHQDAFDLLAQNIAKYGQQNITSVNLGWEWNYNGACCISVAGQNTGWDNTGNQALYIQYWRALASSFQKYAPNIIRAWCGNHILMNTPNSKLEDWYPGDDVVDAVGLDTYSAFAQSGAPGIPSTTDLTNDYGWLYQMSNATFLGANHPAKATGSMTIKGVSTPIPFGGKKYIVLSEWQDTNSNSNSVQLVFQWINQCAGRVLVANYWNGSSIGGGDLLTTSNGPGQQFVAATNGKTYPAPYPIPRLSAVTAPSISITQPGTIAKATLFTVSGTLANYTAAPTLQYQDDTGTFQAMPSGASVTTSAFVFTHPGLTAGTHTVTIRDANTTTISSASAPFTVYAGVSPSNSVVTVQATGSAIIDNSNNAWTLTAAGQVVYNGVTVAFTSAVTMIAIVNGVIWQFGSGAWYSFGPVDGNGVPTTASGPITTSPLTASPNNTQVTTAANQFNVPVIDNSGNVWTITTGGQVAYNGVVIAATSAVTILGITGGVIWQFGSGSWYSFGAVDTNGVPTTASGPVSTSPFPAVVGSLTIITPTQQNANLAFSVSGTIVNYSTPPTLQYRDDSGTFQALPAGASVTATSFSFTNPGLAVGAHTISVQDANNTSVTVSTPSFNVVAVVISTITVTAPSLPVAVTAFTLSGTLGNYGAAPSLTYADDGGTAQSFPAGSSITATSFTFTHPGLSAASHTTVISDGNNTGQVTYSVTTVAGGASADKTVITPGTGSITDASGNRWTVTAAGQIAVNGLVDQTTSSIAQAAYVSGAVWKEDSGGLWQSKASPTSAWLPANGTPVAPLTVASITINALTAVQPITAFAVSGSLVGYTAIPTLSYIDDAGVSTSLPSGATVTSSSFSFTHPGMPTGTHQLKVTDGTVTGTVSYTIATAGWTNIASTQNTTATITGLQPNTAYDIEVFATNVAGQGATSSIATVTTTT